MSFNEFFVCVFSFFDQATVGPNLDLLCVQQSDAAPFVKIMQKELNRGWDGTGGGEIFCAFFS